MSNPDTNQVRFAEDKIMSAILAVEKVERKKEAAQSILDACSGQARILAEIRVADANVDLTEAKVFLAEAKIELTEAKIRSEEKDLTSITIRSQLMDELSRNQSALQRAQDLHQVSIRALSNAHELAHSERLGCCLEVAAEDTRQRSFLIDSQSPSPSSDTSRADSISFASFWGSFSLLETRCFDKTSDSYRSRPVTQSDQLKSDCSLHSRQQKGSFDYPACTTMRPGKDQEFVWGLMDKVAELAHEAARGTRAASGLLLRGLSAAPEAAVSSQDNARRIAVYRQPSPEISPPKHSIVKQIDGTTVC